MSCPIQSEDGTIDGIIILGGKVQGGSILSLHRYSREIANYPVSTEIMMVKDKKWIEGPRLPIGIKSTALVSLPPTLNYACVAVGGSNFDAATGKYDATNVYGLNRSLTTWTVLGQLEKQEVGPSKVQSKRAFNNPIGFPLS